MRRMESDNCFVCGSLNPLGLHLDITEGEGWARALWTVEKPYVGYEGMLHGGIMASIMDDLMAHALYYGPGCGDSSSGTGLQVPVHGGNGLSVRPASSNRTFHPAQGTVGGKALWLPGQGRHGHSEGAGTGGLAKVPGNTAVTKAGGIFRR
ncbi:MAG: PaaI family thioesterase [Enterocloster bolteae]